MRREQCPNCHEQKHVGLPCKCGYSSPDDCELCPDCGTYKVATVQCTSAKCVAARHLSTSQEDRS